LFWPHKKYRADLDILVAGCGTWQAAKYALCRPEARVTGIDISNTSLDHTEKLKRKYNLTNLELQQVAIEQVIGLDQRFDLIICTGVLHHLVDPDAGLSALRNALKPDGVIYLMVYAAYGRTGIYMIQEYCRRLGIGTSEKNIGVLVELVRSLPQQHPLTAVLLKARDAANPKALADALLNPRDQAYTVPQLLEFIDRNGLTFARWHWQAPYLPQCGSIAATAHGQRLATFSSTEQYAGMELFRGTMTTHSAIVSRNGVQPEIHFDRERLSHYVPIRLPTTLCVLERLPPGAAGVLLNQSHSFTDLILPISQREKTLFDAINGRRSVSEIANGVGDAGEWPRVCDLFQKLWKYDQVVFNASNGGTA
jgi:SAM-dependent methyltransferase